MRRRLVFTLLGSLGCAASGAPIPPPVIAPTVDVVEPHAAPPPPVEAAGLAGTNVLDATAPPTSSPTLALEADGVEDADPTLAEDPPYENGGIDDDESEPLVSLGDGRTSGSLDARLSLSDEDLKRLVRTNVAGLGSLSLGVPSAGGLVNGVPMTSTNRWTVIDPGASWGTQETVDALARAVDKLREAHPDAPPLLVGHVSGRRGGPLSPHRSHQSGRDVDLGYFYRGNEARIFRRATAANLDAALTWTFVRALVTETDVEAIFMGRSIQRLLKEHALHSGEDREWIHGLFQHSERTPVALIRHVPGHDNHLHVRFHNPTAEALGRRVLPFLPEHRIVERRARQALVAHRVRKGETLAGLARQYGTSVAAIRKANRLRSLTIVAGRTVLIPQRNPMTSPSPTQGVPRPVAVPPRRLPPTPAKS